jgi:hypothetical protein
MFGLFIYILYIDKIYEIWDIIMAFSLFFTMEETFFPSELSPTVIDMKASLLRILEGQKRTPRRYFEVKDLLIIVRSYQTTDKEALAYKQKLIGKLESYSQENKLLSDKAAGKVWIMNKGGFETIISQESALN